LRHNGVCTSAVGEQLQPDGPSQRPTLLLLLQSIVYFLQHQSLLFTSHFLLSHLH